MVFFYVLGKLKFCFGGYFITIIETNFVQVFHVWLKQITIHHEFISNNNI